ncbi:hypothetical protein FQA39_LY16091 [Lamprigera yunnana]|nr:hypothetical protein FQA39_LY16091 [Lamprigera yunnana]
MSSNDQYALNWSNHTNHIKKAFDSLLSGNEFVDVTLSCEGKKVSAHKMLLSACSIYFHDLFRDNPCQHPIVILRDVKYQNLVNILKFIYCGEVSVGTEDFDDFLKTAELFQISGLTDEDTRNSITEKENEMNETANIKVENQRQVWLNERNVDSDTEKEVSRKRPSEVSRKEDCIQKRKKIDELPLNVEIKQETENITEDTSTLQVKDPLDFEETNESIERKLSEPEIEEIFGSECSEYKPSGYSSEDEFVFETLVEEIGTKSEHKKVVFVP